MQAVQGDTGGGTAAGAGSLLDRCAILGVLAWQCDAEGMIVKEPREPAELRPWIESALLRSSLKRAASQLPAQGKTPVQKLFEGCWLVPLAQQTGVRCSGWVLALLLEQQAMEAPEFHQICASAGMEPARAARALAPLLKRGSPEIERALAVLQWSQQDLARVQTDKQTLDQFSEKLAQAYEETNLLFRLARFMNCVNDPSQLVQLLCNRLHQILPFRWLAIRFGQTSTTAAELSGRLVVAGNLPCTPQVFERHAADLVEQWTSDFTTRLVDAQQCELAALSRSEILIEPITHDGLLIGAVLAGNKWGADPDVTSGEMRFVDAAANFLGIFHENVTRFAEQHTLFMGMVQALTASVDAKDPYTRGHSERVAYLASQLAAAMKFDKEQVEHYRIAGLLHDVGKIGVPEAVLCKPGRLTAEEFAQIKLHPEIGYRILKDIPALAEALPGVLHHHERWDGRGYPHGLAGEGIPLIGRILALADTFDAMSSTRSYRPAIARNEVIAEIARCAGSQFDPALAPVFTTLDFSGFDRLLERHRIQAVRAA